MCKLYPVEWSRELALVWKCRLLPHFYLMLLKKHHFLHPHPRAVWIMESPIPLGWSPGIKKNCCQHHNEREWGSRAQVTDVMSLSIQHPLGPVIAVRLQPPVTRTVLYPPTLQPITHCHSVIRSERKWKFECKVTFLFACCSVLGSRCLTCAVLEH